MNSANCPEFLTWWLFRPTHGENREATNLKSAEEEKHVVEALQRYGNTEGFSQKQTCRRADRAALQDSETRATLTLPYISGLSESIRRILSPLSIWVSFRPLKTLKHAGVGLSHGPSPGVQKEGSCLQHPLS